jgi:GT2 family glycosyltransferase
MSITAIIVSYNRLSLLRKALAAHAEQTSQPTRLLIVDNASTDGTREMLAAEGWLDRPGVELLALPENTGGAGGFAAGMKHAFDNGAQWVWMMDDDAEPHPDALAELMRVAADPMQIYGSLAVCGDETSWLTTVLDPPLGEVDQSDDVPACAEVQSLPFLGFLVHRDLVARIGLPDASYFIAADDVEYCVRAQRAGAKVMMAGKSHIEHPKSRPTSIDILGKTVVFLSLPPWKRYYDTRNRLLIARRHYGSRLFTQTIPGSLVRLVAAMRQEPRKLTQLHAFAAGFIDGLLGIKGKRHAFWRIQ